MKSRQSLWETPRNLAIIIGVVAALFGTVTGILGFKLGSQGPQPIVVRLEQPLAVKVTPP